MNSTTHESPPELWAKELRCILLSVKITGTVFMLLACCYCFAGLYAASGAASGTIQYWSSSIVFGKDWLSDLAEIALFSHWPVFVAGVSLSLLALVYVWRGARQIPVALYGLCIALAAPLIAGMVLHTGARDSYDAVLLRTRAYLEARNLL